MWLGTALTPLSAFSQTTHSSVTSFRYESSQLTPAVQQNWQWFGFSTAIDGNTLVVSAKGENQFTGAVYVYEKQGEDWANPTLVARLTASDGRIDDQFGHDVAVSGNTIVVGTYCNQRSGRAYIFEKPDGGWRDMSETAIVSRSDSIQSDYFGSTVEIYKETIAVSAYGKNEKRGSIYLYQKSDAGWVNPSLITEITLSDLESGAEFGYALDLDNDALVVGCFGEYLSPPTYVFIKPQNGWQDAKVSAMLQAEDSVSNDHFGCSVSLTENAIVVGANAVNQKDITCGAAYVFEKPSEGWNGIVHPSAKLTPSIAEQFLRFGIAVDASSDHIVIGGFRNNLDDLTYTGSVYVFHKPNDGWRDANEDFLLKSKNAASFDYFGYNVLMQNENVFTGAYGFDQQKQDCGAVFVHNINQTPSIKNSITQSQKIHDEILIDNTVKEIDYPFQSNRLTFKHYGFKDGLKILPVEHMLEDHQGYMWFGSSRGLCRFNGYQFQKIGEDIFAKKIKADINVTCLLEDQNKQLWVGTRNGIVVLDPWRETVRYLQSDDESEDSLTSNDVHCMDEDQNGVIWIGVENGLNRYNPISNQITSIQYSKDDPGSIPDFPVLDLKVDNEGKLWLTFGERLFCRYDPESNKCLYFYSSRYTHDWIYKEGH